MNASTTIPAAGPPLPALDLTTTFGALLIGIVFSSMLYGVTVLQAFLYFQNYSSDGLIIKISVIALLIFETLHSAFSIHAIYFYLVTNYMNPLGLSKATWSATMTLTSSTAIVLVVHLFYIKRIYAVSQKNLPLVIFLTALALAHVGTSIAVEARAFQLEYFASFVTSRKIVDASLISAAVIDVLIAAILSIYLHKSRSGIQSTDTIINKLMAYAINNGILTSVFDIIVLVFVTTQPDNLMFLAIFQVVGNLYTNSMLATLNSRQSLKSGNIHVVQSNSNATYPMTGFKADRGLNSMTVAGDPDFDDYSKSRRIEISVVKNHDSMV